MRTALLIALAVAALAGTAQAQTSPFRNPYGLGPAKDPYDLPKRYQGNPYDRDYSKPNPATRGPGYRNVDGSLPTRSRSDSYGGSYGSYGSRFSEPSGFGVNTPRYRRDCKPGLVC
jgi:hypothetical protein